ncbi:MAG: DUF4434 domain-containing protein [Verrucomicrobia bacterium]|nr:DUF4434 domain-containing protein [Verrucomicrobiota bacterium]
MIPPLITGSFIDIQHVNNWDAQYWVDECREWTDENWDAIVGDMHALGLDTLILTGCAIWGRPLYPANPRTVGRQLPMRCADPVGALVKATERRGMAIYLGLGAFGRYSLNANPDLSPEHNDWLGQMAVDLRERYGGSRALRGFYLTAEAHGIKEGGLFAQDDCDKTARFVRSIRECVPGATLMMSPANLKKPRPDQLDALARQLEQLNVDIFAYQDHAGFEKVYPNLNFHVAAEGYAVIKPLHEQLGQQLWVNCEVFEYTEKRPDGRRVCTACEFSRLERQLQVASAVADKVIIYQYQGLMNRRSPLVNIGAPGAEALYRDYAQYRARIS